jgi:uncharacterized iron-regulated membrane protein
MASGINSTFRQVGIATGVAGLGAVFQSRITSELTSQLASVPRAQPHIGQLSDAVASGAIDQAVAQVPPGLQAKVGTAADTAFIAGFNEILLIGATVAIVGGILGFLMVRKRDFVGAQASAPQPVAADGPAAEPVTAR